MTPFYGRLETYEEKRDRMLRDAQGAVERVYVRQGQRIVQGSGVTPDRPFLA